MNWQKEAEVWEQRYNEQTQLASEVITQRDGLRAELESVKKERDGFAKLYGNFASSYDVIRDGNSAGLLVLEKLSTVQQQLLQVTRNRDAANARYDEVLAVLAGDPDVDLQYNEPAAKLKDALLVAFVQGAKWWEYKTSGATMFQSDQRDAEAEAEKRAKAGTLGRNANPQPARPPCAE